MKNLFTLIGLIVSLTLSAGQQYLLPIGSNVNNRQARVQLAIGGYGVWAEDDFAYTPAMGELEALIKNRLWKLAEGFVPAAGYDEAKAEVLVTPGPFGETIFKLQQSPSGRWVVPTEALNVELVYGSASIPAQGVTGVEVEVRGNGRSERFSTIDRTGGSVCEIDTTLFGDFVVIHRRFAVPKYRELWWTEGEVTLWEGGLWARFNILDGSLMDSSPEPPAFLSQLLAPPTPPRITSIRRIGDITELTVSVDDGAVVVLEFSENLRDWRSVEPKATKASANSRILSHWTPPGSSCGFYRVRVAQATPSL